MKLHVPDMTCNHCVQSITKTVQSIQSEAVVVCDLTQHTVEIDEMVQTVPVTPQQLIEALDEIGFEATLVQANA